MLLRLRRSSDSADRDAVLALAAELGHRPGRPDGPGDLGARNTANLPLSREVGRSGRPVLLERGFGSTVEELEVHPAPGEAHPDGAQTASFEEFAHLVDDVRGLLGFDGRRLVCARWTETPSRSFDA
jgi:hypothetical protein